MTDSGPPKRILFVCVENCNRSRMAEAFARMYGGGSVEAYSAGCRPAEAVHPKAIAAMQELGYDLPDRSRLGRVCIITLQSASRRCVTACRPSSRWFTQTQALTRRRALLPLAASKESR